MVHTKTHRLYTKKIRQTNILLSSYQHNYGAWNVPSLLDLIPITSIMCLYNLPMSKGNENSECQRFKE
jgi:hypothetical protein